MLGYLVAAGAGLGAWLLLRKKEDPGAALAAPTTSESYMAQAIELNRAIQELEDVVVKSLKTAKAGSGNEPALLEALLTRGEQIANRYRALIVTSPKENLSPKGLGMRARLENAVLPVKVEPVLRQALMTLASRAASGELGPEQEQFARAELQHLTELYPLYFQQK
jgi:hypothetical protein